MVVQQERLEVPPDQVVVEPVVVHHQQMEPLERLTLGAEVEAGVNHLLLVRVATVALVSSSSKLTDKTL